MSMGPGTASMLLQIRAMRCDGLYRALTLSGTKAGLENFLVQPIFVRVREVVLYCVALDAGKRKCPFESVIHNRG